MDVNVMACMCLEYGDRSGLVGSVPAADPQKQPALLKLMLEIQTMMNAKPHRQHGAYGAARAASKRGSGDCCGECATGCDNCSGRDDCAYVNQPSNQPTLCVANGFRRNVRGPRYGQVIRHEVCPAIRMTELLLDRVFAGDQTKLGPIKSGAEQLVNRGL
jgi:hypothetical protein